MKHREKGVQTMSRPVTQPNREKALRLALVLGWAGVHRFYTNQTVSGLAYLLFCWTLIPGLLSLVDAAFLARMSDDDFADEYGSLPEAFIVAQESSSNNKKQGPFELTA
jgi:TM2 domain-containing membrane protein YozV